MVEEPGKPKPLFWITMLFVIGALVVYALMRADILFPKGKQNEPMPNISKDDMNKGGKSGPEAPDASVPTTVKEYQFVSADKLPPVKGVSGYKLGPDNTVKFALNVWAGWAPIIYANNGFAPGKTWTTSDGQSFKIELTLIDDPVAMRDAYASGNVEIGWA